MVPCHAECRSRYTDPETNASGTFHQLDCPATNHTPIPDRIPEPERDLTEAQHERIPEGCAAPDDQADQAN